jgi:hypothetical protein
MENRFRYDGDGNLHVKVIFAVKNEKYPMGMREIMWVKVLGTGTKLAGTGMLESVPKIIYCPKKRLLHYRTHPEHGRIFGGWCKSHLHLVESVNHASRDLPSTHPKGTKE